MPHMTNLQKYAEIRGRIDYFIERQESYVKDLKLYQATVIDFRDADDIQRNIDTYNSQIMLAKSFLEGL